MPPRNSNGVPSFSPALSRYIGTTLGTTPTLSPTLKETSAKVAFAVAAVCDRRRFPNKFACCRRSQSAATGLLQRSPKGLRPKAHGCPDAIGATLGKCRGVRTTSKRLWPIFATNSRRAKGHNRVAVENVYGPVTQGSEPDLPIALGSQPWAELLYRPYRA